MHACCVCMRSCVCGYIFTHVSIHVKARGQLQLSFFTCLSLRFWGQSLNGLNLALMASLSGQQAPGIHVSTAPLDCLTDECCVRSSFYLGSENQTQALMQASRPLRSLSISSAPSLYFWYPNVKGLCLLWPCLFAALNACVWMSISFY